VNVGNLPASQRVNGTVGIDPAQNQISQPPTARLSYGSRDSGSQVGSGQVAPGQSLNITIDTSAYKEAEFSFNSPSFSVQSGYTVTISDGFTWTLDSFTVGWNSIVDRHYDFLPTGTQVTITAPSDAPGPVDWGFIVYGRGN
jgi:hypothetical protein